VKGLQRRIGQFKEVLSGNLNFLYFENSPTFGVLIGYEILRYFCNLPGISSD
jgi:hypothetical protein